MLCAPSVRVLPVRFPVEQIGINSEKCIEYGK